MGMIDSFDAHGQNTRPRVVDFAYILNISLPAFSRATWNMRDRSRGTRSKSRVQGGVLSTGYIDGLWKDVENDER